MDVCYSPNCKEDNCTFTVAQQKDCLLECLSGCVCKYGFVRMNGRCVSADNLYWGIYFPGVFWGINVLPAPTDVLPCGAGEVYKTCFSSGCKEDTCGRRITAITICPRNCGMGCVCKKGLVRIGGDCVDPSRCVAT
ncbi:unnamed protein product, partial [Ixodes pacificus]